MQDTHSHVRRDTYRFGDYLYKLENLGEGEGWNVQLNESTGRAKIKCGEILSEIDRIPAFYMYNTFIDCKLLEIFENLLKLLPKNLIV